MILLCLSLDWSLEVPSSLVANGVVHVEVRVDGSATPVAVGEGVRYRVREDTPALPVPDDGRVVEAAGERADDGERGARVPLVWALDPL